LNLREYKPLDFIRDWISIWPILLLSMIVGGSAGFLFDAVRPPIYEASASIQVSVDRNRALIPDDYTLLRAFDKVRLVFLADETLEEVLRFFSSLSDTDRTTHDVDTFRSQIRLAQNGEVFQLYVYANSPKEASQLANLWAEVGLIEIEAATRHSLRAGEYQSALYGTWCELTTIEVDSKSETIWLCKYGDGRMDPDELQEGILEEVQKSRGILPIFSFSLIEKASPPGKPLTWTSGWYVLCGALIGLVLASLIQSYRSLHFGFRS
jgi:hypothetical protein